MASFEGEMKPRERVEIALNHEIPDRCPMQVSFTPEFADRLYKEIKSFSSTIACSLFSPVKNTINRENRAIVFLKSIDLGRNCLNSSTLGTFHYGRSTYP